MSTEDGTFWIIIDRDEKLRKYVVMLEMCVRRRGTALRKPVPARGVTMPFRVIAHREPWAPGDTPSVFALDGAGTGRFHEGKILKSEQRFVKPAKLADVPAKDRGIFQGFIEGLRKARK